jgi:hypothetical protein
MRDHEGDWGEERRRRRMSHNAIEPRHVTMAIRREVYVVIIVKREVLMDRCVWMMGIGTVPVLQRQDRGERDAGYEGKPDDCHAQLPQHTEIMGRAPAIRQTHARPLESLSPQAQARRDAYATHAAQGLALPERGRAVAAPRRDARHVPMD